MIISVRETIDLIAGIMTVALHQPEFNGSGMMQKDNNLRCTNKSPPELFELSCLSLDISPIKMWI